MSIDVGLDELYNGQFCYTLANQLSEATGKAMVKFTEKHPFLGRVFCPFVCLGVLVAKLALRVLVFVEIILVTPFACLIGNKGDRGQGFKALIPDFFITGFGGLILKTPRDLWFQGAGSLIGLINPEYIYNKMDYANYGCC